MFFYIRIIFCNLFNKTHSNFRRNFYIEVIIGLNRILGIKE